MRPGGTTAILVSLLLLVPACGGGGGDTNQAASNNETEATQEPIDYGSGLGTECLEIQKGRVVTLEAGGTKDKDFGGVTWVPRNLKLPAGEFVTLKITNPSNLSHDFTSEDLDCQTETFAAGKSITVSFEVPPGETDFVCSIHKAFMTGNIIGTK